MEEYPIMANVDEELVDEELMEDDLMEVDEEMLTQDGELVVKTDLPLSFFDNTDSLEFVDDFDGMEKDQRNYLYRL